MHHFQRTALEEQEVRQGEERRLQTFASKATLQSPNNPAVAALDAVVNRQSSPDQSFESREEGFKPPWRSFYDDNLVYANYQLWAMAD